MKKRILFIILAIVCLSGAIYFIFSPTEEEIKQDEQQQEVVKEEVDSTANEKLDALDELDFDAELGEGVDPDTLGH